MTIKKQKYVPTEFNIQIQLSKVNQYLYAVLKNAKIWIHTDPKVSLLI